MSTPGTLNSNLNSMKTTYPQKKRKVPPMTAQRQAQALK